MKCFTYFKWGFDTIYLEYSTSVSDVSKKYFGLQTSFKQK